MAPSKSILLTVVWLIFFLAVFVKAGDDEGTDWWDLGQRIKQKVLKGYDASAMPNRDRNGTTTIHMFMSPTSIWIDDATQILTVRSHIFMKWKDKRLKWKPRQFGGMEYIFFSQEDLWRPDITVFNNAKPTEVGHFAVVPIGVLSNGWVVWPAAAEMNAECPQDLTYWPYDRQNCVLSLGSWTTHGWQLDFVRWYRKNTTEGDLSEYYNKNHHWRVENMNITRQEVYFKCCPEPYVSLHVSFILARDSPSFIYSVILPGLAIALLTLIQFTLAFDSKHKLALGCLASLLACFYVIYLAKSVPHLGTSCPIILKFLGQTLIMAVLSISVTCIVIKLCSGRTLSTAPPPPTLIVLLTSPLARVLLLQDMASKVGTSFGMEADDEQVEGGSVKKSRYVDEWRLVAASFDRVIGYAYVIILVVSMIVYVMRLA